ncbi:ATP-binding protein [Ruoffia tabacinasalis]|uniref:ATP-binding protein n=1 Tax=Ruoffia tabacinasalis TaxID=87458 RepID=A0A5R9DXG9_9LACT|nr:ATP-binding protein [Ruoffia tabacinasalis]TLQ41481.1 ATP-binding protein [Ruoffia tabacinasalis]
MNNEQILKLISKREDEFHDFKQEWYKPSEQSEFIKDIFSFVNTSHHQDCYIIIGVDDNQNIIGLDENDENRRTQQQLIDWVRTWPTANYMLPPIEINSLTIDSKLIDVITIKDTKIFLSILIKDTKV